MSGDFEAGATGFSSDYVLTSNIGLAGTNRITTDPSANHPAAASCGDNTSGSDAMMAVNGFGDVTKAFWRQTVSVAAGTQCVSSMFASNWNAGNATPRLLINGVMADAATSAMLKLVDVSPAGPLDFAVDDLSFVAFRGPIPAALPLMMVGRGALGFAGRRRAA